MGLAIGGEAIFLQAVLLLLWIIPDAVMKESDLQRCKKMMLPYIGGPGWAREDTAAPNGHGVRYYPDALRDGRPGRVGRDGKAWPAPTLVGHAAMGRQVICLQTLFKRGVCMEIYRTLTLAASVHGNDFTACGYGQVKLARGDAVVVLHGLPHSSTRNESGTVRSRAMCRKIICLPLYFILHYGSSVKFQ